MQLMKFTPVVEMHKVSLVFDNQIVGCSGHKVFTFQISKQATAFFIQAVCASSTSDTNYVYVQIYTLLNLDHNNSIQSLVPFFRNSTQDLSSRHQFLAQIFRTATKKGGYHHSIHVK